MVRPRMIHFHHAVRAMNKLWRIVRCNPKRWIFYISLTLVAVVLEMGGEIFENLEVSNPEKVSTGARLLYQRFATAGFRKPHPHFVQIITLVPESAPGDILSNACEKREFVAAMIQKLVRYFPSEIVLDFWYASESCAHGEDIAKTEKLKQVIDDASNTVPIVIGRGSKAWSQLQADADLPNLKRAGLARNHQILETTVPFTGANVHYGLIRLSADTRRIPIEWLIYPDKDAVLAKDKPLPMYGLAYQAAAVSGKRGVEVIKQTLRPENFIDDHPFTSFIPESEFQPLPAIELLCGQPIKAVKSWKDCKATESFDQSLWDRLRGQIILIGESADRDQHNSVIGQVQGYLLQANYIESILDDRYFKPLSAVWEIIFTICGAIAIIVLFDLAPKPRAFGISLVLVLMVAAVCNIFGFYLGRFMGFWLPLLPMPFFEFFFAVQKDSIPDGMSPKA